MKPSSIILPFIQFPFTPPIAIPRYCGEIQSLIPTLEQFSEDFRRRNKNHVRIPGDMPYNKDRPDEETSMKSLTVDMGEGGRPRAGKKL